jgi:hypothetical protein
MAYFTWTGSTGGSALGPASSTDNAIVRFDGSGGSTLQNSAVLIDDSNNMTGMAGGFWTGPVGILASAAPTSAALNVGGGATSLSGTTQIGVRSALVGASDATARIIAFSTASTFGTAAAAFTSGAVVGYFNQALTKGAGSTMTRTLNMKLFEETAGTNNAMLSDNETFTGDFAINLSSTRASLFTGPMRFGSTSTIFGTSDSVSVNNAFTAVAASNVGGVTTDLNVTGNTAITSGQFAAVWGRTSRTITTSTTDSSTSPQSAASFNFRTVVSAGQTYTNAQTQGINTVIAEVPQHSGSGSTAITNASALFLRDNSGTNTGTRKTMLRVDTPSGATNGAVIADNQAYTSAWFINQTGSNPSLLTGGLQFSTSGGTKTTLNYYEENTFTITGTGFSANPTGTARYVRTGSVVTLFIPQLTGTSNTTTFTLTGIPARITPARDQTAQACRVTNNGTDDWGIIIIDSSGTFDLFRTAAAAAWTGSGTKTLYETVVTYTLT